LVERVSAESYRVAIGHLDTSCPNGPDDCCDEAGDFVRAYVRQLEKVAEAGREVLARYAAADLDSPEWRLAQALAELDAGAVP
jgi:hypothetical protein